MSIDDYHDSIRRYRQELVNSVEQPTQESGAVTPSVDELVAMIANETSEASERANAVTMLNALAFSDPTYNEWRPRYMDALRTLAKADIQGLRAVAFENLVKREDTEATQQLVVSLSPGSQPLIAAADALRILAGNPHTGAVEAAKHYANDDDMMTRLEALRVMAVDVGSIDEFSAILINNSEPVEVRAVAATALGSLNKASLQNAADQMLIPESGAESSPLNDLRSLVNSLLAEK